ncbi:MAG: hypothetical protein HC800_02135 [Phormidesmis sp. RL_2_1]|nr:hypothetical protein [Phormidesmis sp. RL_2_1]
MADWNKHLLDYHALGDRTFESLNFARLETSPVGPVTSRGYSDFFKCERYDAIEFSQQLIALFGDLSVHYLKLFVYPQPREIIYYGFAYLENFQIVPVIFGHSANFEAWMGALCPSPEKPKLLTVANNKFGGGLAVGPDLWAQTADFLRAHAPKHYLQTLHQSIKQAHLNSFKLLDTMKQVVDSAETEQLWRQFSALKGIALGAGKPVDTEIEAKIEQFAALTGFALPLELQVIYRLTDGASEAFGNLDFLSLSQVMDVWQGWQEIFDDWTMEELTGGCYTSDRGQTLAMYCNPFWVPFIDNVSGNYYAIDLMPGEQGKQGQIIAFGADTDHILCLADNLNDLLRSHIALLENPSADHPWRQHFFFN